MAEEKLPVKVVELPSHEVPAAIEQHTLRNGIMAPKMNGNLEITGRIESSDGKTYFDLNKNYIIINDGTYDRILIGYQLNGF